MLSAEEAKRLDPNSIVVSADGQHYAYAVEKLGGLVYVVDGKAERTPYARVLFGRFSEDGKDFAYVGVLSEMARVGNQVGDAVVVVNGTATPVRLANYGTDPILGVGAGVAVFGDWVGQYRESMSLKVHGKPVVEYKELGSYDKIHRDRVAVSTTGGKVRVLCAMPGGIGLDGKVIYRTKDTVNRLLWSANGETWAAVMHSSNGPQQEAYVVVNGSEQRPRLGTITSLVITPDGKHVGFLGFQDKGYAIVDGVAHPAAWKNGARLVLPSDGTRWAVDDVAPVLGSQGPAKMPEQFFPKSSSVSPDALHYVTLGSQLIKEQDRLVSRPGAIRDGVLQNLGDQISQEFVRPVWSPDGKSAAIVLTERDKGSWVERDGRTGPRFASLYSPVPDREPVLAFSPNSRHLLYAVRENLRTRVVLDDQPRGAYELVGFGGSRIGFTPDGRVTYVARKVDGSICWVEETPEGQPAAQMAPGKVSTPGMAKPSDWQALFDGTDLSRWKTSQANSSAWKVTDGLLTTEGMYKSTLISAGDRFGDFHLRLIARTSRENITAVYVRGAFVRIDNTAHRAGNTGSIFPSSHRAGNLEEREGLATPTAVNDQWFTLEVIVCGNRIATRVDGKRVAVAELSRETPAQGEISLVTWSKPAIAFRRIEVREESTPEEIDDLGKATATDQGPARKIGVPSYTREPGFEPLFDGKSLDGWREVYWKKNERGAWVVRDGLLRYEGSGMVRLVSTRAFANPHLRIVARSAKDGWLDTIVRQRVKDASDDTLNYAYAYGNSARVRFNEAGVCRLAMLHFRNSSGDTLREQKANLVAGQWYTLDLIARGPMVTMRIDGEEILRADHKRGEVELQPGQIELRAAGSQTSIDIYRIDVKEQR
ncbi:MAG: family 16 glycoside hydrolase [Gemmataceae bacterium]